TRTLGPAWQGPRQPVLVNCRPEDHRLRAVNSSEKACQVWPQAFSWQELRGWPAERPWTQTKTCFLGFAIRLSLLMAGSMQGECQGNKPLNSMACKMRLCRIRDKTGDTTKKRWC